MEIFNDIQHNLPLYERVVSFRSALPGSLLGVPETIGNSKEILVAKKWLVLLLGIFFGNSVAIAWLLVSPAENSENLSTANTTPTIEFPARPSSAGANTLSSNAALIQRIRDTAFELVERVARQYPQDPEALCLLGKAHLRSGNPEDAVRVWQAVRSQFPEHAEPLVDLGFYEQMQGNLDAAKKHFSKSLVLAPERTEAWEALGKIYLAQEDWSSAMKAWEECLSRKDTPSIRNQVAIAAIMGKAPEMAITHYSESLVMDPSNREATIGLVQLFAKEGDKEKAKRYERRLAILDEERRRVEDSTPRGDADLEKVGSFARFAFAESIRFTERYGDKELTLAAKEQLVDLFPEDSLLMEQLLAEYNRQNKPERGSAFLKQLTVTRSNDPRIWLTHAKWSLRHRALNEAESSLNKVVELQGDSAEVYALLAQTKMPKDRNPRQGLADALKALEMESSSFHHYLVATAYYNVGDKAKTKEYLEKSLEIDPNNNEARAAIDRLANE